MAAISRMASWMGLPSITAQVALGWAIKGGAVQGHDGVKSREAGRYHLRPAAEAREEVGLDEPRRDTHVGAHPVRVEPYGDAADGIAGVGVRGPSQVEGPSG